MDVVIIGTGNVATIIGKLLVKQGHTLLQLIGRNEESTVTLANTLQCGYSTSIKEVNPNASIYIIAVSDACIGNLAKQLDVSHKLIVHTAGSVSIDELINNQPNFYGVLWPMQTLRKEMETIPSIPFVIDASNESVYPLLYQFAQSLSPTTFRANDEKRLQLHLAAVIASNFSNHLYALTEQYCKTKSIDFRLLFPLLEETVNRLKNNSPADVQTGPAIRKDEVTINRHIEMLAANPSLKSIYQLLTKSIMKL